MSLFRVGKLSWKLLYPILSPFCFMLALFSLEQMQSTNDDGLILLFLYISMIFAGILEIISRSKLVGRVSNVISISKNESTITLSNSNWDYITKVVLPIGSCALFDFLGYLVTILLSKEKENKEQNNNKEKIIILIYGYIDSEVMMIQLFFLGILSYIILNYQIYIHQKISISLSMIGMIFIIISTLITYYDYIAKDKFFLLCLGPIFTSMGIVLEKNIMQNRGVSSYQLLFIKGIFGAIITFAFFFGLCNIDSLGLTIFIPEVSFFTLEYIGYPILIIIFMFLFNLFYVQTNYYFTPCHTAVCDTISSITAWLSLSKDFKYKEEYFVLFNVFHVIGYILITVSVIMYNEFVIFSFCGMDVNTKEMISQRSIVEALSAIEVENEEEDDNADTTQIN